MPTGVWTPPRRCLRIVASAALVLAAGISCGDDGDPLVGPIDVDVDVDIDIDDTDAIAGSGATDVEERDVDGVERVVLAGEGALTVTFGNIESLTVGTDDNLLEYIETEVIDGTLEIRTRSGIDIAPTEPVEYELGAVALQAIELRGAGSIDIASWSTDSAIIVLSGAGDIGIDELVADDLVVELAGVGTIVVDGSVDDQDVSTSGVGEFRAGGLQSRTARVDASGPALVQVWVIDALDVDVRGPATLEYYGDPTIVGDSRSGTVTALGPR